MVLIWQNSIEQGCYSADELTRLQVRYFATEEITLEICDWSYKATLTRVPCETPT